MTTKGKKNGIFGDFCYRQKVNTFSNYDNIIMVISTVWNLKKEG